MWGRATPDRMGSVPSAVLVHVSDPSDPRLDDYRNLTDAQLRARAGAFIAESELVVRRLLQSRFPTRSLLIAESARHRLDKLPVPDSTPVYIAPDDMLRQVVGFHFHRGVLAAGERLPPPPLPDVLSSARLFVVLENTANTDNMGAVFRNTACLVGRGAAVLLSPGCCDPLYRKALRVSIGYALTVPFTHAEPWPQALSQVAQAGFTVLALTPDPHAEPVEALPRGGRYALLLGAEGPGLSPGAFAHAARRVRIPMAEGADSLNVATAAAIALSRFAEPQ
jgi:tRNA G18 (ribose-2'-O)-methylase SpoU